MLNFIQDKHIAFEANQLFRQGSYDAEYNWHTAVERLKIFPDEVLSLNLDRFNDVMLNIMGTELGFIIDTYRRQNATTVTNKLEFHGCRETLEKTWLKGKVYKQNQSVYVLSDYFYFSVYQQSLLSSPISVPFFIRLIETQKLNLTQLTKFQLAKEGVIKVTPSDFWSQQTIRFSLFTLLLRAGYYFNLNCENPNYEECYTLAIKRSRPNGNFLNYCVDAINRFMDNYTWYIPYHLWEETNRNWIDNFNLKNKPDFESILVRDRPHFVQLIGEKV